MCLAIPGRIEYLTDDAGLTRRGQVNFGGVIREINLAFVPEAGVGDWVLAHVGVAIAQIDADAAALTLSEFGADPV